MGLASLAQLDDLYYYGVHLTDELYIERSLDKQLLTIQVWLSDNYNSHSLVSGIPRSDRSLATEHNISLFHVGTHKAMDRWYMYRI